MFLLRLLPGLLMLITIFVGIELLYWFRASSMRALARRLDLRFTEGDRRLLVLRKDRHPIPPSFRLKGYPVDTLRKTWNVIEGETNGVSILILDSILGLGGKQGRYATFIAARTDQNPFSNLSAQERIAHSNGWTALYRMRFWQIPWTLSIQRIEEHLARLGANDASVVVKLINTPNQPS